MVMTLKQIGLAKVETAWEQAIHARVTACPFAEKEPIDRESVPAELRRIARLSAPFRKFGVLSHWLLGRRSS